MSETVAEFRMSISADDLKRQFRERADFVRARRYTLGRITYLAHGKGHVMVRYRGAAPFCLYEKEWRKLPFADD